MWYDHELTAEELLGKGAIITNIVEKIKTTTGIDLYATHFMYEYHAEEDRFPFRFLITDETGTKIIEANIIRYKDETDGIEKIITIFFNQRNFQHDIFFGLTLVSQDL